MLVREVLNLTRCPNARCMCAAPVATRLLGGSRLRVHLGAKRSEAKLRRVVGRGWRAAEHRDGCGRDRQRDDGIGCGARALRIARQALTRWVTGLMSTKASSQVGRVVAGTKALDSRIIGYRTKIEIAWTSSAERAARPSHANPQFSAQDTATTRGGGNDCGHTASGTVTEAEATPNVTPPDCYRFRSGSCSRRQAWLPRHPHSSALRSRHSNPTFGSIRTWRPDPPVQRAELPG